MAVKMILTAPYERTNIEKLPQEEKGNRPISPI